MSAGDLSSCFNHVCHLQLNGYCCGGFLFVLLSVYTSEFLSSRDLTRETRVGMWGVGKNGTAQVLTMEIMLMGIGVDLYHVHSSEVV